ncbi:MAG: saccharopine dehydrogenase [Myxococcota bacterium]
MAAAIAEGTHTADLTGEPQYVRGLVDRHHRAARDAGVRIVNCCGFDSIPSDLGTLVLQQAAQERLGGPCPTVRSVVWAAKGGFSGGTAASAVELMADAEDPAVRAQLADPYSLDPGGRGTAAARELRGVRKDPDAGWVAPWLMASINERVVRRSNALLGYPWGEDFAFTEVLRTGRGARGALTALGVSAGVNAAMVALTTRLGRRLARRVLPSPGEGPSEEAIARGFYVLKLFGERDGQRVTVEAKGQGDPGYGATSRMLAAVGACLARDGERLGAPGITTPAAGLGAPLVERLARADITFTASSGPS